MKRPWMRFATIWSIVPVLSFGCGVATNRPPGNKSPVVAADSPEHQRAAAQQIAQERRDAAAEARRLRGRSLNDNTPPR